MEVVWFHLLDTAAGEIPQTAKDAASIISDYYKAGGDVFLTTHVSQYLVNLGRITEEYGPTGGGNGNNWNENPDNWGISYMKINDTVNWYASDNDNHEFWTGLTTGSVTFEGLTYLAIFFVDAGFKKDASRLWDFNQIAPVVEAVSDPAAPNACKEYFETATNSTVRASFEWDPAANGVELGTIIEWHPEGDYSGIGVTVSLGAYEWSYQDGDDNQWESNVKGLTANILDYLGVND